MLFLCVASLLGGLWHGATHKSLPQVTLMALLGALTIPVVFVDSSWWVLGLALVPASVMCAPTIASTGEEVTRLAPVSVRGVAVGLQSSALTLGAAAGSPVVGFVVDHTFPGLGFVAAGVGGLVLAAGAFVLTRTVRRPEPLVGELI
jgi:predicted MFS family arabinose efflux permease